jgi:hypothetical protein
MQDKPLDFSAIRPEIMAFALLMEKALRNNNYGAAWKIDEALNLAQHAKDGANELLGVIGFCLRPPVLTPIPSEIRETVHQEAVGVANMAMMVADVTGCLEDAIHEFVSYQARLAIKDKQRGPLPFVENTTAKSRVRGYSEAFHAGFEAGFRGWAVNNPYVSSLHRKVWEEGAFAGKQIIENDRESAEKSSDDEDSAE